eukprot:SAG31_NODE_19879_length_589_cov_1.161224_1_plen_85_part_10
MAPPSRDERAKTAFAVAMLQLQMSVHGIICMCTAAAMRRVLPPNQSVDRELHCRDGRRGGAITDDCALPRLMMTRAHHHQFKLMH